MTFLYRMFAGVLTMTLFAGASAAGAAGATPTQVVAALEKGYDTISDLQADFSQRTPSPP